MKYLILVRGAAWNVALTDDMIAAGVHVAADGLTGPELARGVVASPPVTAFYLIDCDSADEASAWATRSASRASTSANSASGDFEVRPVLEPGGQEF